MAAPYRGNTGHGVYFITACTFQKKNLLQSDRMAGLLVEVLLHYRAERKYLLHEFVVMPDHFHLLLTPVVTLERRRKESLLVRSGKRAFMTGGSGIWRSTAPFACTSS